MARDAEGKVIFDAEEQAELDRIIGERVARAKAEKPADYDDLKRLEKSVEKFEYKGTAKEKADALEAYLENKKQEQELADLEEQAKTQGTSPELLKEIREAKKDAKEAKDKLAAIEAKETEAIQSSQKAKLQEENYQAQRKLLLEKHEVDADNLEKNAKFMKFMKGKSNINLIEEYEDFVDFIGETETEAIKKVMSKEARSTSGGKGENSGGNHGLTKDQMETVNDWNKKNPRMQMSYREFAEKI